MTYWWSILQKRHRLFFVTLPMGKQSLKQVQVEWVFENERFKRRTFRCRGDGGNVVGTKSIDGVRHVRMSLHYPRALVLGYYRLTIKFLIGSEVMTGQALVIVSPRHCYRSSRPRRSWGITVQLYGLRSPKNWGMGDLNDLQTVVKWAGTALQAGTRRRESDSCANPGGDQSLFTIESVVSESLILEH